jgi:hypothetical protein
VTLAKICTVELVSGFRTEWSFELPEIDNNPQQFPASSEDYIKKPLNLDLCSQVFRYTMIDGSDLPAELTIDSESGIFTLLNSAERKVDYAISITVTTSDGTNV